ncbi:MOSC domain-containing protein [Pseudomonas daroniae]|uniref:MOSC domain-containing protein n=1 Tax=Phytopseudomonas daroniae TaxID=2487519 RepID=A0A4Q9QQQ4_9GAMM|nr:MULTISPECIES: MOSC domain-containing protein [Pseudomonas]TBU77246.1 MOSC domain-containing protein [Pseudomonas daroniae]TBU83237.1 MOSC domain-containing protein [Pseudomonas daroniae]TBU84876.1 MOSC domain-containing protein [Pseudomonas sp. FRB 228]TBU93831.1 MOSC domain-containing protein [Pseudomonas daroniae]
MHLSSLYRFPLKSAIGESLPSLQLDGLGVVGDRRWMLADAENGRFLTQRTFPRMSGLQARWNQVGGLTLEAPDRPSLDVALPDPDEALRGVIIWRDSMRVPDAGDEAAAWVSEFMGKPCRLVHVPAERARYIEGNVTGDEKVGFADGFPLLLIGQASLDDLVARVGRPLEMLRFRPNLVVQGSEPYAEDSWKRIRIGGVEFTVAKGCSRCIITTIDPQTGERSTDREPLTTLRSYRQREGEILFGQNLINHGSGELLVGMPVEVLA